MFNYTLLHNCRLFNNDNGQQLTTPRFFTRINSNLKKYTIPIYSGILGVLIPEKKLIPLNLMPLELEFSLNPHALYCMHPAPAVNGTVATTVLTRDYRITKFEIYANVIMFE